MPLRSQLLKPRIHPALLHQHLKFLPTAPFYPGTFHWSQPDLGMGARPGPLSHAACCLLPSGRHVAVFGGYRSGSGLLNELWVLDLDRWEWSQPEVAGDIPRARRGHVMEALGDLVVVHGGYDGQAHSNDLYVLVSGSGGQK